MSDYFDEGFGSVRSGWAGWHPSLRAVLIFTLPFIVVDFFNYYSAGTALVISCPIEFLIYAACGALAAKFGLDSDIVPLQPMVWGGLAGAGLWTVSTLVNTVIGLFLGTISLGVTLILGIPYLLCCTPLLLGLGSATSLLGAMGYIAINRKKTDSDSGY